MTTTTPRTTSATNPVPAPRTSGPAPAPHDPARVRDVVGVGIGPFNLGLAALSAPLDDVDAVFLDAAPEFRWHPGMMIEGATIQVPFLADLVTMADPTSPYSFLAFLKATGRLYPFYIRESFYPLRAEYDAYCRWVAARLGSLRWSRRVVAVEHDPAADAFVVRAEVLDDDGAVTGTEEHRGRHLVLGVGTAPVLPPALRALADEVARGEHPGAGPLVHSAQYLPHRDALAAAGSVTVVGSGQSAAEVYRDLLDGVHGDARRPGYRLDWVTRSPRFFPMEYTKLTLEMTSPEYTDHFHALPLELRQLLGREQRGLYKGISGDLVDDIYDALYRLSLDRPVPTTLLTDTEVVAARYEPASHGRDDESAAGHPDAAGEYVLRLRHAQLGREVERRTRALVAATGYAAAVPAFLDPVRHLLRFDELGRFDVARDYTVDDARRVHVLNGEEHTHGITAPDLGFAAWRNAVVLRTVTGREVYPVEERIAFQTFGLPDAAAPSADRSPTTPLTPSDAARVVAGGCPGGEAR
ncbi:lysine N(6)-hydroxylase/L-ornithine N(5)-oxygenase family protein [Cellulosimicrobium cellulans]|uniref:lysine N(6)-hydroxylase/L-ornithine N(5)-oxygenase family protein n=1 Tax=Cellulosimicrobium cellulans TaxID=1710 RepID=UPI0020980677|nr:SidA/IucD/PvdA family monooxygenase [Cellulosimicrobium cellulans]MCO7271823.1 SidA/IucD/PvdA family monooxygenase [Cellulosimicrobium cellulans]